MLPTLRPKESIPLPQHDELRPMRLRQNASMACRACQRSKSKCTGEHPCKACSRKAIECLYTPDHDRRRNRKRRVQELEDDSNLLHELFDSFRNSDDVQILQLGSLIRSNASAEELRRCVEQQQMENRSKERESTLELESFSTQFQELQRTQTLESRQTHRHTVISVSRLIDSPPFMVPSSPWTTVTNDDALVSSLVSLWITWDQLFFDWIDVDLFLSGIQSQQLESLYCSPFLVNALLAQACPYSDFDEARTQNGAPSDLMLSFIDEANRVYEIQESCPPTITTIQGLAMLCYAYAAIGQDKVGYEYLKKSVLMLEEFLDAHTAANKHCDSDFERALDKLCWGLFNAVSTSCTAMHRFPIMKSPQRQRPQMSKANQTWVPYPTDKSARVSHKAELEQYVCDLSLIVLDLNDLIDGSRRPIELPAGEKYRDDLMDLDARLLSWRSSLPQHLVPSTDSAPGAIWHYSNYLTMRIALCSVIKELEGAPSEVIDQARSTCRQCACEIASISSIYATTYGHRLMNMYYLHPLAQAIFVLVDEEHFSRYTKEFIELCLFLRAMAQRWLPAMAMLRMVQLAAQHAGKPWPTEVDKLFEDFHKEDWVERQEKSLQSYWYPAQKGAMLGDIATDNLTEFLNLMDKLHIDDKNPATENT